MKRPQQSIGNLLPLVLSAALVMSSLGEDTGNYGLQEAVLCVPSELSPCMPALSSPVVPSGMCCQKLREQQPCFCGYLRNPAMAPYVGNPRAKEICRLCGVPIPSC